MREPNRQKVAIATGSSSGIGYATSLILARNGFYTYVATKFVELEPFGIKVILIEPGAIGSGFMKGSIMSNRALDPKSAYFEFVRKVRSKISSDHENATQPEEVVKTIVQAVLSQKPEFRYVVGTDAVTLMQARKKCHSQISTR